MSREIEFRAWHFPMEKMFSAKEMTLDQMAILPDGHFANIMGEDTSKSVVYSHKVMLPLQYTGLKDKNSKEVYEGDIVACSSGCPHEVIWEEASMFGDMGGWNLSGLKPGAKYDWIVDSTEVIGNIYEDPELLEAKS